MGVRWYVADPLSSRQSEALLEARGVEVEHATLQRWGVQDRPPVAAAFQRRKRPGWVSWRMDEPSIKSKGQGYDLYRAVDKHGQTSDVRLTEQRAKEAALRLLQESHPPSRGPRAEA